MGDFNLTQVVKNLLIINVIFFVASQAMPAIEPFLVLYFPTRPEFRVWQIFTHMFMHANFSHILFNMYGLAMFGPPVEYVWGPKRFLQYYLITGLGAFALHMAYTYFYLGTDNGALLGASGALFGVLAAYAMLYPNNELQLMFIPYPIKAKYFIGGYALIEIFSGIGNRPGDNTAHFAHVGGALAGFLLITLFGFKGDNFRNRY
jgi:membrane associated rhomboid family serine protease